jgi:predicted transposase YbfD/YdcC
MQSSRPPKGIATLLEHLSTLQDRRVRGRCLYSLQTVVVIGLLGVLCGAEGWVDLETFARSKQGWLREFLDLPPEPPKEGVFRRVFSSLRPAVFEACFRSLARTLAQELHGQVVAFDGKAMRGAIQRPFDGSALHQVHAWVGAQRLLLAREMVEGAPDEGEAIRAMLGALELTGAIVTMDAGNASKANADAVIEAEADYVITVKSNRRRLHTALRDLFEAASSGKRGAPALRHQQTRETGHGRHEVRDVWVAPASALGEMASYWRGLRSVVMVRRTRVHVRSGRVQSWVHYYGSSLAPTVRAHTRAIREHWGVENGLHWVLDVQMGEDDCPIRDANGASNFAALRRFALTLLQRDKTVRQGTRGKQKEAGWNNDFLLHLLSLAKAEN